MYIVVQCVCVCVCVCVQLVVMAVLNLAAKAREVPVKLSDVVNTCHRYTQKHTAEQQISTCPSHSFILSLILYCSPTSPSIYTPLPLPLHPSPSPSRCLHPNKPELEVGDVYWHLKDSAARYELLLLRALRFDIYITTPHSVSQ